MNVAWTQRYLGLLICYAKSDGSRNFGQSTEKTTPKKQGQIFKYFLGIYSQPHDHFLLHWIQV